MSAVLRSCSHGFMHRCPACGCSHVAFVRPMRPGGPTWKFDGNVEKPTFSPSLKHTWGRYADPSYEGEEFDCDHESGICHYSIEAGRLRFYDDCTHEFAGQTVDMPAYEGEN